MSQEVKKKIRKKIEEPKIWYPLGFLMEMKDTDNPHTGDLL